MIGHNIAGRYQIENEVGSGGMGTVYRGIDTQTGQLVAIKHLKPELARADLIERFKREGAALVPEPKSPLSTMRQLTPCSQSSRNSPVPLIPAPRITTSMSDPERTARR